MVHCHPNARLTPRGRAAVFLVVEAGMTVAAACLAFNISRRSYYRWLPRWQRARHAGLHDHSSRPLTSPQRLSLVHEELNGRGGPDSAVSTCEGSAGTGTRRL